MKNKIPKFKSEKDERAFWAANDSVGRVEWSKAERTTFPNLKPTSKAVSHRSRPK